jgi:putative transposase
LNSKLHAVCDGLGRTIIMLLTEGLMSDHKGALLLLSPCPTPGNCAATRAMTATGSVQR